VKFIDEATILVKAGDGGNGCVSFARSRFNPRGGPDGGDGGKGGDVILKSTNSKNTLIDFQFNTEYIAESGEHGGKNGRAGADGKNITISLPAGSVIKNARTGSVLVDLDIPNKEVVLFYGGRGGKGNSNFATASRQSPDFASPAGKGERLELSIELKLLADVGIIGFPNAGKSTLISRISAARPKIADYPFTTLVPNLGVVKYNDHDFVVADVPGLIEGASQGTGLGIKFLKHIERTKVLLHVVDVSGLIEDPIENIKIINNELKKYSKELIKKPMLYVINKIDAKDDEKFDLVIKYLKKHKIKYVETSCVANKGLNELIKKTHLLLKAADKDE